MRRLRICMVLALAAVGMLAGMLLLMPGCEPQTQRPVPLAMLPVEHRTLSTAPTVRVMLADRLTGSTMPAIQSLGNVSFETPDGTKIKQAASLPSAKIAVEGTQLSVGYHKFTEPNVMLRTGPSGTFSVGSRSYRGDLEIMRRADGTVTLVNCLDLESYIRGVVAGEAPKEWPLEALKVQAVASRSYAYALVIENGGAGIFDVTADFQTTQVYQGILSETPATDQAVRETRGMVLTYNGKPFRTYFSSTCAGHTEACGLVWNDYATIAPLSGVECNYCEASRYYSPWLVTLDETQIRSALEASGRKVSRIKDIKLSDRNSDGHMDMVEVVTDNGTIKMLGNEFRLAVGSVNLKSMRVRVEHKGTKFAFNGRGFGHGVGMCQFGACGMVKQGRVWEEVVHYYYPASDIWKIYL